MRSGNYREVSGESWLDDKRRKGVRPIDRAQKLITLNLQIAMSERVAPEGKESPDIVNKLAAAWFLFDRDIMDPKHSSDASNKLHSLKKYTIGKRNPEDSPMSFKADENWFKRQLELFNFLARESRVDGNYAVAAEQQLIRIVEKVAFDKGVGIDETNDLYERYFTTGIIDQITQYASVDPQSPHYRLEAYRSALIWHFKDLPHPKTLKDSVKSVYGRLKTDTSVVKKKIDPFESCLLYTSPSPRDRQKSRMPSSA